MSEATVKIVVLKDRSSWADWFDALRRAAGNKGIWDKINPFNDKAIETNMAAPPRPPHTIDELILKETEDRCTRYRVETENWDKDTRPMVKKGSKPVSPQPATFGDVRDYHSALLQDYEIKKLDWTNKLVRYRIIRQWLRQTVDTEILTNSTLGLEESKQSSIRKVLKALSTKYGSTDTVQITAARRAYSSVLLQASKGGVSPKHWFTDWEKALNRARALKIAEIEGTPAVIEFLMALQRKLAPTWATEQLSDLYGKDELGLPILTLEQYGQVFNRIILENQNAKHSGAPVIFAILGNRTSKGSASKPDSDKYKYYECPYKESKNFKYRWDPLSCTTIEIAITGSSKTWTKFKPNEEQIGKIRERLLTEYWKDLKP
jgi:hypothetical protein